MGLFGKIFKKKEPEVVKVVIPPVEHEEEKQFDFPEGQLVPFPPGVIDTTSAEYIAIFKHNLEFLKSKAKEQGYIDKFMLIREDDYFPVDYKWRVNSSSTILEKRVLGLSYAIRNKYALENAGINNTINGMSLPVDPKVLEQARSRVDLLLGAIYQPAYFRSTKHFTINTPLEVTGSYNQVEMTRDFTILDSLDNFLTSGYGYSLGYYDAYLDVSHEALDISPLAIILMEKSKYDDLTKDVNLANTLKQRRVVLYEGDQTLAIEMLLTQEGILPSQVGEMYCEYDDELNSIIQNSLSNLASSYNLLFNQSHSGLFAPEKGHFSNYFDELNPDLKVYLDEFISFMQAKFPDKASLFTSYAVTNSTKAEEIVNALGTKPLLMAINEYNKLALERFNERKAQYIKDHDNITPENRNIILQTIALIKNNYHVNMTFENSETKMLLDSAICQFYQAPTIAEELEAAKTIWRILDFKLEDTQKINPNISR